MAPREIRVGDGFGLNPRLLSAITLHWRRMDWAYREQDIRAPREFHASLGQVHGPELQLRLPQWDNHTVENDNRHGIRRQKVVPKHLQNCHLQRRVLSS